MVLSLSSLLLGLLLAAPACMFPQAIQPVSDPHPAATSSSGDPRSASSDDPSDLTAQALAEIRLDHLSTAHQLLNLALASSPNNPAANDALGNLLLSEHHYPEAMDRFETALATNLHDPAAREGEVQAATALALQARSTGSADAAYLTLQHAREHLPDDPTLLLDLGIQAQQMHLLQPAAEALNAALAMKPGDPQTNYALARVETDQDHLSEAEKHFRAYLAARPGDASAHFGLGHVLERQQRIEDAKTEFQRSIELQPVQTEAYYQLGQIALDAGQPKVAAPLFAKTLDRNPRHGGALSGLGILAYREKNFVTARDLLTTAVQDAPDYQPGHYYLGLTLARLGEKAGSERELKLATELARQRLPQATIPVQPAPNLLAPHQ